MRLWPLGVGVDRKNANIRRRARNHAHSEIFALQGTLEGSTGALHARTGENVHPTIRHRRGIMGRMGLFSPPFFSARRFRVKRENIKLLWHDDLCTVEAPSQPGGGGGGVGWGCSWHWNPLRPPPAHAPERLLQTIHAPWSGPGAALLSQQSVLSLSRSILQEAEASLIHGRGNTRSCIKDETKCFTWDHLTGPRRVSLISINSKRPSERAQPGCSPGAPGPAAPHGCAGGIFIAVH